MGSDASVIQRAALSAFCALMVTAGAYSPAQQVPVPCVAGSCGPSVPSFVTSGAGSAVQNGNTLNVTQTTENAIFNWQSFNIGPDGRVNFTQPSTTSVALNRIFDSSPSRIFGVLTATGRVYLLNRNGIVFGNGAQVNVGGLVASSLDVTPAALEQGIARAARAGAPAFDNYRDAAGNVLPSGAVRVLDGASLTAQGGQILLFAPEVGNEGVIRTPDGQTILAAGQQIYLTSSTDPNLRGLLVEVSAGGTVTNGRASNGSVTRPENLAGQIIAERGNVTLAGLAVNQLGRVSATTSVRANGSVRLLARDGAAVTGGAANPTLTASNGGTLNLGSRSDTSVTLDANTTDRTVDVNAQPVSTVLLEGRRIRIGSDARVTARAGQINVIARADPRIAPGSFSATPDDARIVVERGATLDVAGAQAELPMERNLLTVELRGSQLADSPAQRDGPLRCTADNCTPVTVDIRASGTRADGSVWQGTPLADLSGDISTISRSVAERSLNGGTVALQSSGEVVVSDGATIDLSGGVLRYLGGTVATTQLLGADGRIYDIANADPARRYVGVADVAQVDYVKWGVSNTYTGFGAAARGNFESGYVEGRDAGLLNVLAPRLIFDGRVRGDTTTGRYQRLPSQTLVAGQIRPYNQLPLGAGIVFGNSQPITGAGVAPNYVLGPVVLGGGLVLPTLLNDAGQPFDPTQDAWPSALTSSRIRPNLVGGGAAARLSVFSNGRIDLPADASWSLPAGGSLSLTGSTVSILGRVDVPSGTVAIAARPTISNETAGGITLGAGAQLLARGGWVNDDVRFGLATAPLHIAGGSVSLLAEQSALRTSTGSLIDVSGGAWRRANGAIVAGRGGSVSLTSTATVTGQSVPMFLDVELRGFALSQGGTLSIAANAVCIAEVNCSRDASTVWLSPQRLNDSGFGDLRLASNLRGLEVLPGTTLTLRQTNLDFVANPIATPTGTDLATLTRRTVLDPLQRRAVNLALTTRLPAAAGPFDAASFATAGDLRIGRGASIDLDAGATLTLRSNTRLLVDGAITAPAGTVALQLDNDLSISGFLPTQGIWLGSEARIDARGVARIVSNDRGERSGQVLDGGLVALTALRGYIVTLPGSRIDVSGVAADVDVTETDAQGTRLVTRSIGSRGGSVALRAAEGMLINGDFAASGGRPSTSAGGSLSLVLDTTQRNDPGTQDSLLPLGPRRIVLTDALAPWIVAPGAAVPSGLNGQAFLAANSVEAAGFDFLGLAARSQDRLAGGSAVTGAVPGEIEFRGDVNLALRGRITLDAAGLRSDGGAARIAASVVTVGHTDVDRQGGGAVPATGSGQLRVEGEFLQLVGTTRLSGFGRAEFVSRSDIQLRGVQGPGDDVPTGRLLAAGDLRFEAQQIFPTTLTDFEIAVVGGSGSRVRFDSVAGGRAPVLSAGGRLVVSAPIIEQAGVLRAPFGSIVLDADELVLASGSLTSTSAEGALIPFGTTQGRFDWTVELPRRTLVYGVDGEVTPQQRVLLAADRIEFRSGAVVDVSGGGDLLAYEFVPGTSGTRDVLDSTLRPNQFAVLPALGLDYAPFDPGASPSSSLQPGDSIYLSGGGGLAAGFYTLLPARYALLPGAYLVTAIGGYQDLPEGSALELPDGSTLVSGYRTLAGTTIRDPRNSGFAIRAGTTVQREARYDLSRASEFFAAQYAAAGVATPRLTGDAGVLSILAGTQLELAGQLRAVAAMGGRGAAFDLSGTRLEVVSDSAGAAPGGAIRITAGNLSALGAESILLGGTRTQTATGTRIDVAADTVTVAAGANLSASELLLAARDRVTVSADASLTAPASPGGATAGAVAPLLLDGDSALVRVASSDAAELRRTNSSGARGNIEVSDGATLSAGAGSITLDASRDARSAGTLATTGTLALGAARITLGDAAAVAEGLQLTRAELEALSLRELRLRSGSSVDLLGTVSLDIERLGIDAGGLRAGDGQQSGGVQAELRAGSISLANSASRALPTTNVGDGALTLAASEILLGAGTFGLAGFRDILLQSGGDLFATADGQLAVSGAARLAARRIAALSGVRYGFTGGGELSIAAPDAAVPAPAPSRGAGLGARFDFSAQRVALDTLIAAPAGLVTVRATGTDVVDPSGATVRRAIEIGPGARVDAAGRTVRFDGVDVAAHGGVVALVAERGGIAVRDGAVLDVSAATVGDAGRVELRAAGGRIDVLGDLRGSATPDYRGGEIIVDAFDFGAFGDLNRRFNAGGFDQLRDIRLRGPGDIIVAAGGDDVVTARSVSLVVDQGSLRVDGTIRSGAADGGEVLLAAAGSVGVAGTIDARARNIDGRGGRVQLLASSGGSVLVADSARIDVTAGAGSAGVEAPRGGRVDVRVDRGAALSVLDASPANDRLRLPMTAIVGAARVGLEGFAVYTDADGVIGATDVATTSVWHAEATAFMANAGALRTALGWGVDPAFVVRPGVEVRSTVSALNPTGGLRLASNWNLADWRYGDVAGVLTLRAPGTLQFDASLSDGFAAVTGANAFSLTSTGESWSYRLAGGADLASAAPLAVLPSHLLLAGSGDVRIAAGTPGVGTAVSGFRMIRTGTGDIDIAAGRNFELGNRVSVVYTAGRAGPGVALTGAGNLGGRSYPVDGGDVRIRAQGDVRGAQTNQLITDWLWRTGRAAGSLAPVATGWTVNFQRFEQNIGALGGGDVIVRAGGDVDTLSAVAPSIGRQIGGTTAAASVVEVIGRGNVDISAGGDVRGGVFYVGGGRGRIRAGGSLTADAGAGGLRGLHPILALDSGSFDVSARNGLTLEAMINPSLLPQAPSQLGTLNARNQSYFSSYGESAGVRLTSIGGDLVLLSNTDAAGPLIRRFRDTMFFQQVNNANAALRYAPPRIAAASLSGNLDIAAPITLFPSAQGSLSLFAREDLRLGTRDLGSIIVSDVDPGVLPGVANPSGSNALLFDLLGTALTLDSRFNADVPLAAPSRRPVGAAAPEPIRLVALEGSILHRPEAPFDTSLLYFSRPARIIAGEDIRDLALTVQHVSATDLTTIVAGRDLIYSTGRESTGAISPNARAISVDGPGRLDIEAGRDVDLQASAGITTRGNLRNPALADSGASISILAGVGEGARNFTAFIDRYLADSLDLLARLRDFVAGESGGPAPATSGDALTLFRALAVDTQRNFLDAVFPDREPANGAPPRRTAEGASVAQRRDYLATLVDYESRLVQYVNALVDDRAIEGGPVADPAAALAVFSDTDRVSRARQSALLQEILFAELRAAGRIAAQAGDANGDVAPAFTALTTLYPGSNPDTSRGETNRFAGDIRLFFSRVYTLDGGGIDLVAPGGSINVGLASPPAAFGISKRPDQLGIVAQGTGSVRALSFGDFEVNESRVFAADGGSILVWSTRGDIDAGRGAKTAISAPPPLITFDDNGFPVVTFPAALTGSGIQTLATSPGRVAGDVDLFAPRGVVNAGDAGIVCRNCTIFATAVIGANNIQVGGVSVGVPVDTGGLAAGLTGVSNVANSASSAATAAVSQDAGPRAESETPLADSAVGWLEVFIEGFGDEVCKPNDQDCLERNRRK